ncbi:MAG TPA: sulfurtransferase TusA family protein [Candidatus Fimicola cottocaccae]|nr:sulfurtransferase TusA family protein [Candidatus Fimicola cottocaccae]
MDNLIDARGLACPEPVIMVQQAVKKSNDFQIIVDNNIAVQNITRFCNNKGFAITKKDENGEFILHITKE